MVQWPGFAVVDVIASVAFVAVVVAMLVSRCDVDGLICLNWQQHSVLQLLPSSMAQVEMVAHAQSQFPFTQRRCRTGAADML
jgi:hypothetical protein